MIKKPADALYASPLEQIIDFKFDEQVANVFADMIQRSVPGYANLIANTGVIAEQYAQENSQIYDLGCSLGASTLSMRRRITTKHIKMIAVDNSEAMVQRCREYIAADDKAIPVDVMCQDITACEIVNASVVTMNFTLQFIAPDKRVALLQTIYAGLLKGGVFILSEKIAFSDKDEQARMTELHYAFKKANGYSDLEISQKRTALEQVMIPETVEQHISRLKAVGFSSVIVWSRSLNFISILAFK